MRAAYIDQPGPPESIRFGELPQPQPQGKQVLVRVKAVAVNPIDTYVRAGVVKMNLPSPYVVGCDLAGEVEACGPEVTRFRPGDRVWGSNQGLMGRQGTFAEFAAVDEHWLYPSPAECDDRTLAAGALVGVTAYLGLFMHARLKAGETLFVNGGTGGVGSSVVQMAKAVGARVITTAGSDEKAAACRALGADVALNYKSPDLDDQIRQAAPDGIQVWWETLREPDFERTIGFLSLRGRMVVMAGREARPTFPVGPFYVKDCSLYGFAMFNSPPAEQQEAATGINEMLRQGKFRPRIDRVLPLSEAAEAHRLQEQATLHKSGALAGKLVLEP